MRYCLLFAFALGLISSCMTLKESEEEILIDATAPAGYSPVFIQGTKPFDLNYQTKPQIVVSSVDVSNPNNVKVKMHIVGDKKFYLTGAADVRLKNIWCFAVDSFAGKPNNIKYKLREMTEDEKNPLSIALVADHSGSMGSWRAEAVQNAFDKLIMNKKDEDAFSIIKYDNKVVTEVPLSNSKSELLSNFKKDALVGYGGMTAIADAIVMGINSLKGSPKNFQKAVVVFTDGYDNSSSIPLDSVFRLAKATNTQVFAIDFGADINSGYMSSIADSCNGFYNHIYSTDEFALVFDDVYRRLKNGYILEYNPKQYGEHHLKLRLCLPKDTLQADASINNTPDLGAIGLLNIYFDFDKASIKSESEESLEAVHSLLKGFPAMVIELRGHTDSLNGTKDPDYNVKLSQKRADAVKKELVKRGIDESRIIAKGYGEKIPVADNSTEEGRALNRRTEFVVLRK